MKSLSEFAGIPEDRITQLRTPWAASIKEAISMMHFLWTSDDNSGDDEHRMCWKTIQNKLETLNNIKLPDPAKLEMLADWLDLSDKLNNNQNHGVQVDLRQLATTIRTINGVLNGAV